MAKKIVKVNQAVNPVTINTLNVANEQDLAYEIGLGKLIKAVVDGVINENEINAVFAKVAEISIEGAEEYIDDLLNTLYDRAEGDCECECTICKARSHNGFFRRTWNKIKGWFKK